MPKKTGEVLEKAIVHDYQAGRRMKDLAEHYGISTPTVRAILKKYGVSGEDADAKMEEKEEKAKEDKSVEQKAKSETVKEVTKHVVQRSKAELDKIYETGDWIAENIELLAQKRGLSVQDYLAKTVVFYEDYSAEVQNMLTRIEELEKTTSEMTEYLKPFPYLFQTLIEMIRQGKTFTRAEILTFLYGEEGAKILEGKK